MMEVNVKLLDGKCYTVYVGMNATLGDLKRAAAQSVGESASRVRLSVSNGSDRLLDNDLTPLSSYGLTSGCQVMMLIRKTFQVFVKNLNGTSKTYDVTEEETIDELKQKIYNKERVSMTEYKLTHNGAVLESGKKLKDYNIQNGGTIFMTGRLRGG